MSSREPFGVDEWYHCFNRGIDKRIVFVDEQDAERFLQLLFLTNSKKHVYRSDLASRSTDEFLKVQRGVPLVGIGAYSLMPNHFHILVNERTEGGISTFMQRLGTAYTMYFNIRHERTGSLFMRPFRSRHVDTDDYFQKVIQYIHCNPAELYERGWKSSSVRDMSGLHKKLLLYPYSSLAIFEKTNHPRRIMIDPGVFAAADNVSAAKMLREAANYYNELNRTDQLARQRLDV